MSISITNTHLIVISGPTAAGKTSLSVELAKYYNTEIVSADSRQFYKEMSIGTAKPTEAEQQGVIHHFIDNLSIQDIYSAGDYEREAIPVIEQILNSNTVAIMVGGSGLFIKAVCEGFDRFVVKPELLQIAKLELLTKMSLKEMQKELEALDPVYYGQVDIQNPRRVQRALEVIYGTGGKYSTQRSAKKASRPFKIIKIGLEWPRQELYDRINRRVDEMIDNGLWEEAQALYPYRQLQPLQTVGYQEIFDSMDGGMSKQQAIEKIKQNTRNYSKRQMTWFKKDTSIVWFRPDQIGEIKGYIQSVI